MRFFALSVAVSCVVGSLAPMAANAQTPAPAPAIGSSLSLTDAIAIARRSNPGFQTSLSARKSAAITARSANGAFLPSINSGLNGSYRAGGQQVLNGQLSGAPSGTLNSSGSFSASLGVSASQFSDRKAALSERGIAEADIARDEQTLRVNVTNQYIAVLQSQANARLQDTLLLSSASQLELAKAKLQVGTGIQLDVEQADVANGRQRVAALKAHSQVDIDKIRLFQQMGVAPVLSTTLQELTSMELPTLALDQILANAKSSNPVLESNRARERQSSFRVTSARRQYLPSFSIQTSLGGFAQRAASTQSLIDQARTNAPGAIAACQKTQGVYQALGMPNTYAECEAKNAFTAATEAEIRESQSGFPFGFTRSPFGFSLGLSLPIFNGFQREAGIQNATIARNNAANAVRQQEIQLNADVTVAYMTLQTSKQTVAQQELNARTASLALQLATQRYQVGSISLVDLITARSSLEQAESDRIAAVYEFQRAFAQLEAAVGRPLR